MIISKVALAPCPRDILSRKPLLNSENAERMVWLPGDAPVGFGAQLKTAPEGACNTDQGLTTYFDITEGGAVRQPTQFQGHRLADVRIPAPLPRATRSSVSPGVRRRVYERDSWTCQYCRRRIDPTTPNQASGRNAPVDLSSGSPVWLELDHITPRRLGGRNNFDNLRAACSPCNRRKSDSTQAVDWELRAALAMKILTTRPANQGSVLSAARALLGVTVYIGDDGEVRLRTGDAYRGIGITEVQ